MITFIQETLSRQREDSMKAGNKNRTKTGALEENLMALLEEALSQRPNMHFHPCFTSAWWWRSETRLALIM
jgi:hypothetical protein